MPCNVDKGSNLIMPKHAPYEPDYWALMAKVRKHNVVVPHESWLEFVPWAKLSKAA